MILPDLLLPSRANQYWKFSGIDSLNECRDKNHFLSYPHNITYNYNSRGFRDQEWPNTMQELQDAVWCIGDSFTVGIGSPLEHTWPYILSNLVNRRTINVSMDGASNEWITRVTQNIVNVIKPKHVVIMWSYTHRREHSNTLLSDEDRRLFAVDSTLENDRKNFLQCKHRVDSIIDSVQFMIPYFHKEKLNLHKSWNLIRGIDWPVAVPSSLNELNALPLWILEEMKNLHNCLEDLQNKIMFRDILKNQDGSMLIKPLDLARDGHHFDLVTSTWVAKQAAGSLKV